MQKEPRHTSDPQNTKTTTPKSYANTSENYYTRHTKSQYASSLRVAPPRGFEPLVAPFLAH